jgi:hypothetical protein
MRARMSEARWEKMGSVRRKFGSITIAQEMVVK